MELSLQNRTQCLKILKRLRTHVTFAYRSIQLALGLRCRVGLLFLPSGSADKEWGGPGSSKMEVLTLERKSDDVSGLSEPPSATQQHNTHI